MLASSRSLLKFRYAEPESTLDRRLPYNTEASTEWPQGSFESGIQVVFVVFGSFSLDLGLSETRGPMRETKKNVVHGMVNPFGSKRNSKNTKIQITAQMCQWTDNRCKAVCLPTKKEISMKASIYNWISRRWCKEGHSTGFGLFGVA